MSQRIEPTLGPATPPPPESAEAPGLRIEPRATPPLQAPRRPPPRRFSPALLLLQLVFVGVAVVLLAVAGLRWLPPPTTAYMLQSPVQPVKYQWVPAARIAETMRRAVVASEDQKFWTHHGFDLEAIEQAQDYNREHRNRRRGASTISQQTAKNLFLWPGGWLRKGLEAALTVLLEQLWNKQRILEMYLNIAEFGPGIYGVEAAARVYFGEHAADLSGEQAARLAAVLPDPRHWSVRNPGPYVQARTAWILGQMGEAPNAPPEEPEAPPLELDDVPAPPADAPAPPPADAPASPPAAVPPPAPEAAPAAPTPAPSAPQT